MAGSSSSRVCQRAAFQIAHAARKAAQPSSTARRPEASSDQISVCSEISNASSTSMPR